MSIGGVRPFYDDVAERKRVAKVAIQWTAPDDAPACTHAPRGLRLSKLQKQARGLRVNGRPPHPFDASREQVRLVVWHEPGQPTGLADVADGSFACAMLLWYPLGDGPPNLQTPLTRAPLDVTDALQFQYGFSWAVRDKSDGPIGPRQRGHAAKMFLSIRSMFEALGGEDLRHAHDVLTATTPEQCAVMESSEARLDLLRAQETLDDASGNERDDEPPGPPEAQPAPPDLPDPVSPASPVAPDEAAHPQPRPINADQVPPPPMTAARARWQWALDEVVWQARTDRWPEREAALADAFAAARAKAEAVETRLAQLVARRDVEKKRLKHAARRYDRFIRLARQLGRQLWEDPARSG